MNTNMYILIDTYIYIHMCIYIYMYIHIYAHMYSVGQLCRLAARWTSYEYFTIFSPAIS